MQPCCNSIFPSPFSDHSSQPKSTLLLPFDVVKFEEGMASSADKSSTSVTINEPKPASNGKAAAAAPTRGIAARIVTGGWKKGLSIFDFFIRLIAIAASLAATVSMATTDETLPFFTQLFQFQASFDDFPAFTFFVVGNAITCGYLLLSLPFSIFGMIRPHVIGPKLFLFILDLVAVALTSAAASSAAAIIYLAHKGNEDANWVGICNRFNDFCQQVNGATISSFVTTLLLMLLVVMAGMALRKH